MTLTKTLDELKLAILCVLLVLAGQWIGKGASIIAAIPGALMMVAIIIASLKIKELLPKVPLPAFAWATLIALLLSLPSSPVSGWFMAQTDKIDFLATTTPLLAFAGLSVGNQLDKLRAMSWKIVLIALVVFTAAYFGSAAVAHLVLQLTGVI